MKPNTNKLLFEKAAAMVRAMDATFEKNETLSKHTLAACESARIYASAADTHADRACREYMNARRLAYRAAIGHAAAIAAGVILNAAAGAIAAWYLLR